VPEPVRMVTSGAASDPAAAKLGTIRLAVVGFRSDVGAVRVALFGSSDGFPSDYRIALRKERASVRNAKAELVLGGLPAGTYALSVMHDENDNGELDKTGIGVPTEGAGFSQDAAATFGAPSFEDASFRVAEGSETRVTIHLRYY
jgi:uncharacterized protein (DUF2141 family)